MELETVNKLFLELSQFATATTAREIALAKELAEVKAQRDDLIADLAKAKVADDVVRDVRLGSLLHVWDYENPEDGHWDNIEEFLHDTTPNAGETVRLNIALPLQDVEVEMLEVGKCGEPIQWVVRDAKTGALLAAKQQKEVGDE